MTLRSLLSCFVAFALGALCMNLLTTEQRAQLYPSRFTTIDEDEDTSICQNSQAEESQTKPLVPTIHSCEFESKTYQYNVKVGIATHEYERQRKYIESICGDYQDCINAIVERQNEALTIAEQNLCDKAEYAVSGWLRGEYESFYSDPVETISSTLHNEGMVVLEVVRLAQTQPSPD